MLSSIVRGAIVAAATAVCFALPRSIELGLPLWIGLLAIAHLTLPFAAAFWGRRPDTIALDVGLGGIGVAYVGVLALSPDASAWVHLGLPIGFAAYGLVATMIYAGLERWRTAIRVRGIKRLKDEASGRHRLGQPAR